MSHFLRGAVVRSLVDAQGLRMGSTYEVVEVEEHVTSFGTFVSYGLSRCSEHEPVVYVTNGHLLLEAID